MGSKILVTGGAGYIGSHTCKALATAGYLPVTYDNLASGHRSAVKWGPFEEGDIADLTRLDEILTEHAPSAILHFAAFAYVGESVTNPGKYYRNNVLGSLALLEAAREHKINKVVFSSTCATYGIPDTLPINEDNNQNPINPYGASKLMVERMLADFGTAHGIKSVILRYFNAAGADPANEIGESHSPETHLIPLVLDAASGQRPFVEFFGVDYPTLDGTCVRDFIHVSDLADAHVLALQYLEKIGRSNVFNLGVGVGFSLRDIVNSAEKITGRTIPVRIGPRRDGDPPILISDASKAKKVLGWNPSRGLEETISTAWAWHQRNS